MRFLIDMNLSPRIAEWLREEGHDAVHLRELGLHTLSDASLFALASQEHRIVVTFDLDFGDILAACGDSAATVVLFRLHTITPDRVFGRLRTVIAEAGEPLQSSAVILVEENRVRIRKLPIGR